MVDRSALVPLRATEGLAGFVVNYLICGPFNLDGKLTSCEAMDVDYLEGSGSEAAAMPKVGLQEGETGPLWRRLAERKGFIINLLYEYSKEGVVSYAVAYLNCPKAQAGKILLGTDDGLKLYLNGEMVGCNHVHRGLGIDNDIVDVNLKRGVNVLLLKIEHSFGGYEFCIRLTDPSGNAVKGLKAYRNHPKAKKPSDLAVQRTISGFDYLDYKFANAKQKLAFSASTTQEYKHWRTKFLRQYKLLLGEFPARCPLRPEVTEDICVDNFRRKRVLIDVEPGFSIPCYLTIPRKIKKGHKLPAVLCLHGHGEGKSDMVGLTIGTPQEREGCKTLAMALYAAREGYVTISPDFLSFGERCGPGHPFGCAYPCTAEFAWAQAAGLSTTTINIHTVQRCVDYLYKLPEVDNSRIAAMGHSFGGYMTTLATAVEPRIKAAVISGFMCRISSYYGKAWSCGSQVLPGLFNYGDLSDIACTFAPRPLLIVTGLYDCVTPSASAFAAFKKIKKAYQLVGAQDNAGQFVFPDEHIFQSEAALDWLGKWL